MTFRPLALFPILCLVPCLSMAASISGRITLLDGSPLSGANAKVGDSMVSTSAAGTFALGRTTSASRGRDSFLHSARNLEIRDGRIFPNWFGSDPLGRQARLAFAQGRWTGLPRSAAVALDTLNLFWRGARLAVLPFGSDTGDVQIRVDTGWIDDRDHPWNVRVAYGSLRDARDGRTYRTVVMGGRTWMAENLNYAAPGSKCYDGETSNCWIYGRLYSWAGVMDTDQIADAVLVEMRLPRKGICPSGWHVPSIAEWNLLRDFVGGSTKGTSLKSTSGWTWTAHGNGTDLYGFRALAAGYWDYGNGYLFRGKQADFWTSSEDAASWSWMRGIDSDTSTIYESIVAKVRGQSLRCIADTTPNR